MPFHFGLRSVGALGGAYASDPLVWELVDGFEPTAWSGWTFVRTIGGGNQGISSTSTSPIGLEFPSTQAGRFSSDWSASFPSQYQHEQRLNIDVTDAVELRWEYNIGRGDATFGGRIRYLLGGTTLVDWNQNGASGVQTAVIDVSGLSGSLLFVIRLDIPSGGALRRAQSITDNIRLLKPKSKT